VRGRLRKRCHPSPGWKSACAASRCALAWNICTRSLAPRPAVWVTQVWAKFPTGSGEAARYCLLRLKISQNRGKQAAGPFPPAARTATAPPRRGKLRTRPVVHRLFAPSFSRRGDMAPGLLSSRVERMPMLAGRNVAKHFNGSPVLRDVTLTWRRASASPCWAPTGRARRPSSGWGHPAAAHRPHPLGAGPRRHARAQRGAGENRSRRPRHPRLRGPHRAGKPPRVEYPGGAAGPRRGAPGGPGRSGARCRRGPADTDLLGRHEAAALAGPVRPRRDPAAPPRRALHRPRSAGAQMAPGVPASVQGPRRRGAPGHP
jgi:hypothetical protein